MSHALILVDLQHDFMPGGALAVPDGDAVVAPLNALMPAFDLVVATQDWHPPAHGSFAANHPGRAPGELIRLDGLEQVLWPTHCVQHTRGAKLVEALDQSHIARIFTKGEDPLVDSYSGFFDNGYRRATGLADYLRERQVSEVFIGGLATDYCVKFTALDALREGFAVTLIQDACRGVNLQPGDDARAVDAMRAAGARVMTSAQAREAR